MAKEGSASRIDALVGHATTLRRSGAPEEAAALYRKALEARPEDADANYGLAQCLKALGGTGEAIRHYRACLAAAPDRAEVHNSLGIAYRQAGRPEAAIASYNRAIGLQPGLAAAHNNLGNVLASSGRPKQALAAFRAAAAADPDYLEPYRGLGVTYVALGMHDEALAAFERARAGGDESPELLIALGALLVSLERYDPAAPVLRQAIARGAGGADSHVHLGLALHHLGRFHEACESYGAALRLQPDLHAAHANLGNTLARLSRLGEAGDAYRRALELEPRAAPTLTNLGNLLREQGFPAQAVGRYEEALAIDASVHSRHSNLLLALNYLSDRSPEQISAAHRRHASHFEPMRPLAARAPVAGARSGRRTVVGYVSPDFRNHAVAYFLEAALEAHDRRAFEIVCYANVRETDEVTDRMRSLVDGWRDIRLLGDAQAAELIREDGVDVLVDLAGHTADGRPGVLAYAPAPVQASWLGYPNTTGLTAVDYYITDAHADPPGEVEHLYTEKLFRLEAGLAAYRPPPAPDVAPLPARARGQVTFASLNNPAKVGVPVCALWAEVLAKVPGSRLLLQARAFGEAEGCRHVLGLLARAGVEEGRVEFLGRMHLPDYLTLHGQIDIGLDTFPWSGHTTTCHALWMGVPVVVPGWDVRHSARLGLSAVRQAGLPELVAESPEDYVDRVAALAGDLDRLETLRASMREQLRTSPLLDGGAFTRCLESAFREMLATRRR